MSSTSLTTAAIISSAERYFNALSQGNVDAFLACFDPEAVMVDPYGSRPHVGEAGLSRFFKGFTRTWQAFSMTPGDAYHGGDRVAVSWTAEGRAFNGRPVKFAGINVFTVGDDGLITHLEGYWDMAAMMAQIQAD